MSGVLEGPSTFNANESVRKPVPPNWMLYPSADAKVRPQSPFSSWVASTVIGKSPVEAKGLLSIAVWTVSASSTIE